MFMMRPSLTFQGNPQTLLYDPNTFLTQGLRPQTLIQSPYFPIGGCAPRLKPDSLRSICRDQFSLFLLLLFACPFHANYTWNYIGVGNWNYTHIFFFW